MSSRCNVAVEAGRARSFGRIGPALLVAVILGAGPALATNDTPYEATVFEPVSQRHEAVVKPTHRVRTPLFDLTAVGATLICAFVGSILVFGWQDKWFAGAAARTSAAATAVAASERMMQSSSSPATA